MKINDKRGFTLVELIVSIMLLSGVMFFMFNLLSDIKYDQKNQFFAIDNQDQRVEITNYIEKYILSNTFSADNNDINMENVENQLTLTSDKSDKIYISVSKTENLIIVTAAGDKRKWIMNDCKIDDSINIRIVKDTEEFTLYEASIKIFTDNVENDSSNNNAIDDITFSFSIYKKMI